MKICRFVEEGSSRPRFGILQDGSITELAGAPWIPGSGRKTGKTFVVGDVRFLAPVAPSKIVCIGRNYAAHAAELGNEVPKEPLMFLKAPSAIIGPRDAIVLTKYSNRVEHEAELAVVIGKQCAHLSDADDPLAFVLGYTCVNDVTARDLQKSDVQFDRAKGFDTFCPIGPHIETHLDPLNVLVEARVNG